jgi:transcriptional regulator with XRE-family HTH domain
MNKPPFAKWLEKKYIAWLQDRGSIATQKEFAEYLYLDPMTLSHYINGRRKMPDKYSLAKIAERLGPEVYDVLGLARPDKDLKQVTAVWHKISDEAKNKILEVAKSDYETEEK